jgi:hypothetical protein
METILTSLGFISRSNPTRDASATRDSETRPIIGFCGSSSHSSLLSPPELKGF